MNDEKIENLNRLITNKDIETATKKLSINKSPGQDQARQTSLLNFTKYTKRFNMYTSKLFQKIERKENFKTCFKNQYLDTVPAKDTMKNKIMGTYSVNIDAKFLNKILAN